MDISIRTIIELKIFIIIVGVVLFVSIAYNLQLFELVVDKTQYTLGQIADDDFIRFAVLVEFVWELLPQTAQIIGLGAITTRLLQRGFNPFILAFITATGRLIGHLILYGLGALIQALHKKEYDIMESVDHYFRKYHFLMFILPPWLGVVGDGIMLYAGHQHISLLRIIPILWISNYGDALRWILPTLGQIEISDVIEGA